MSEVICACGRHKFYMSGWPESDRRQGNPFDPARPDDYLPFACRRHECNETPERDDDGKVISYEPDFVNR